MGGAQFGAYGHDTTCYALVSGENALIADCGTGLWAAAEAVKHCKNVDVLITHFHFDHIAGLLTNAALCARARFFVPDFENAEAELMSLAREPFWPHGLGITHDRLFTVADGEAFDSCVGGVAARATRHPGGGLIYRANTADGGVCFAFDYDHGGNGTELLEFARGCRILVYDGMFDDAQYASGMRGHSTASAGAALSVAAGAGRLILTHHAPYRDDAAIARMEADARSDFAGASYAREGERFAL